MAPASGIIRSAHGLDVWEHFENLASLCKDWLELHPRGAYPKGTKRLPTIVPSAAVAARATSAERAHQTTAGGERNQQRRRAT